jgi:hypothetical protein
LLCRKIQCSNVVGFGLNRLSTELKADEAAGICCCPDNCAVGFFGVIGSKAPLNVIGSRSLNEPLGRLSDQCTIAKRQQFHKNGGPIGYFAK